VTEVTNSYNNKENSYNKENNNNKKLLQGRPMTASLDQFTQAVVSCFILLSCCHCMTLTSVVSCSDWNKVTVLMFG